MATVYGVNADYALVDNPVTKIPPGQADGKKRVIYDKYTYTADLSADDVIVLGSKLPKGAMITDARIIHEALGAGTFHLGWQASSDGAEAADADGIMTSVAVTSAGSVSAAASHYTNAWLGQVLAGEVQPIVTVATDTSTTTASFYVFIEYVLN